MKKTELTEKAKLFLNYLTVYEKILLIEGIEKTKINFPDVSKEQITKDLKELKENFKFFLDSKN